MYITEKILFYCVYLLCFLHILVLSHGHGGDHGDGHQGYHGYSFSGSGSHTGRQRVCWINVTSENGTNFVQKPIECHTCCEDGCCFIDTFNEVFGIVCIIIIILVLCYCVYVNFRKKTSSKNIYKEENLQMQPSDKLNSVESRDGVQNYGSNNEVNAAMSVDDLPSKLVDNAAFKPSTGSH